MRKKPKGAKYRNLFLRQGVIYYERRLPNRRIKLSCKTDDWDEAAAFRDAYETRKQIRAAVPFLEAPRFADIAGRYLNEGISHLAASTREDRHKLLGPAGRVTRYFADYRLDDIGRVTMLDWWAAEVEARGRALATGKNYLDAVAAVFGFAMERELIESNPTDALRATLRRRNRTQRGRAASDPSVHVNPIEQPEELAAFVVASEAQGGAGHVCDLLQLDAGLRNGEALGLRWGDVWWGTGPDDTTRALHIRKTLARGRHESGTKSGRARRVALSRRLRRLLRERWVAAGQPAEDVRVLPGMDGSNYRRRHFKRVCRAAQIGERSPKDLRDTFASQLLTAGVQLGYVSRQLGHADVAVTARHYARWAGGDAYRRPFQVQEGEVPADLLERIGQLGSPTVAAAANLCSTVPPA